MAGNEGPAARYSGDGTDVRNARFPRKPDRHFNAPVRSCISSRLIEEARNLRFSLN